MEGACVNKMERIGFFHVIYWVALSIVIVGGVILILPKFIFPLYALFSPSIQTPEITSGEFPFRIEYELNGEFHFIEDTVIAEFDGFQFSAGSMERERRWRSRLASGRESVLFEGGSGIRFFPGPAGYYMGEFKGINILFRPHVVFIKPNGDPITGVSNRLVLEEAQEVLKKHGITLISWEVSEPIINNFGD